MTTLRPYQLDLYKKVTASLRLKKTTVLAAAPSAGKTLISSKIIEAFVSEGKRVLVLAHGTTVLKTQFYQSFMKYSPKLIEYTTMLPEHDLKGKSVLVGIPQNVSTILNRIGNVDLLVVDEAHEFYMAPTVQKIVNSLKPKHTLCLTGTPSNFVMQNKLVPNSFEIIVLPLIDIPAENLSNATIRVLPVDGVISLEDFNYDNEVAAKYTDDHKASTVNKYLLNISSSMFPLMIASRNTKQAKVVSQILTKKGYKVGVSTHENDLDSSRIEDFKKGNIDVLVVVRRGILGFDMPEMKTVIDMTLSRNINRMYQLFARVLRKSEKNIEKEFVKIAPKSILGSYKLATNSMLHLAHPDWISRYDGKTINDFDMSDASWGGDDQVGSGGGPRGRLGVSFDNDPNSGLQIDLNFLRANFRNGSLSVNVGSVRKMIGELKFVVNPDGNKKAILDMATNGEPRPKASTNLGKLLVCYTAKSSKTYDSQFDSKIRSLAPQWFLNPADENRKALLAMAMEGNSRPEYGTKMAKALSHYTCKSAGSYCAEFDAEIRRLAPDWFVIKNNSVANKEELLRLARARAPRPHRLDKLGKALSNYTAMSSKVYDREFDTKIRKVAPKWFVNSASESKGVLLSFARSGKERPDPKSKIGRSLKNYITPSSQVYDREFHGELEEIAPHWVRRAA